MSEVIMSKPPTKASCEGWDRVFGKRELPECDCECVHHFFTGHETADIPYCDIWQADSDGRCERHGGPLLVDTPF
jgi:hypothetical protein